MTETFMQIVGIGAGSFAVAVFIGWCIGYVVKIVGAFFS